MSKSIFASKTFWLNLIAAVIACVQALNGAPWFDPSIQAAVLAVANIGMRFLTSQAVTLTVPGVGAATCLALGLTLVGMSGCAGFSKVASTISSDATVVNTAQTEALTYLQSSLTKIQTSATALSDVDKLAIQPAITALSNCVLSYSQAATPATESTAATIFGDAKSILGTITAFAPLLAVIGL